jgi:glycosyltransferase involved in cell wall biosynthesis
MTPKISIIIPAYNIAPFIERTVESILKQTYADFELIIVNDGSKDDTGAVLDKLKERDPRIKVIHKENGGVTSARLCGINAAQGEWIGFVDGDDIIEPDMYEQLLNNAIEYDADISHCGYQMVLGNRIDKYYGTEKIIWQSHDEGIVDLLEGKFIEPGLVIKLYKAELFKHINEWNLDPSIKNTEDLLMNFYLFRESRQSVYMDKCLYHYIVRNGSATSAKPSRQKLTGPLKVLKIIEGELRNENRTVEHKMSTESLKSCLSIICSRIVSQLINLATISIGSENKVELNAVRKEALVEIRRKSLSCLVDDFSMMTKAKLFWVAICPASYKWVHHVYGEITGVSHKYEVK